MQLTTLEELAWIHDCELQHLLYKAPASGRSIELSIRCPPDLRYAPWKGTTLVLAALDVFVSEHVVFSIANAETIDAIRPGVSDDLHAKVANARRMGVGFPDLALTISFHSGSWLQLICRQLVVDIAPLELSPAPFA